MFDTDSIAAWSALAGAILGPLSGIVVAIIAGIRSRKTKHAEIETEDKSLDIKEQEADTHYWSALVEGFSGQVSALQHQVNSQQSMISKLEQKHSTLEERLDQEDRLKQEMLAHIMTLEQLVPNPPGAPKRPWV